MFKTIPTLSQEVRTEVDTDGDGTPDRFDVDTDGDGTIDRIEFDPDQDGNIDRIAHLDDDGRWVRVDRDLDDDGTIDCITHYGFDGDGNRRVTRKEFDLDDDGTIDRSEAYIYDGGNRARIDFDLDNDGLIDRTAHLNAEGRWERVELDVDDDGTIDRTVHRNMDGSGTINRIDFDDDGDGTTDRSEFYTHNPDSNRTRVDFDDDADGMIDRITHYAFDGDGNRSVTRRDVDLDDDGTIDRIAHLNAEGRWERVERDDDDDGNIDRITHFAFDGDGNRSVTRRDEDLDDDGNIDRTIHLNAEGRWERVELDDDDDGTIDRTVHRNTDTGAINRIDFDDDGDGTTDRSEFYTQNADGNRDRASFDDDADGTIDRFETYSYDANDRVSQTSFDDDNDGTTDRSESYTYDANDRVSQTNFDDDNDGTTDRNESYTYDVNDRVSQASFDDDNDSTTDRSESYTYDANDRVSQTRFDDDVDGTTDRSESYTYDESGTLVRTDFDDGADGTTERSESYVYNSRGRLSQVEFDDDGDDTTDRSEAYEYNLSGRLSRSDFDDDNDGNIDRAEFDDNADGTTDRSEAYFYTNGRRTRTDFDDDADGNIDRVNVAENRIAVYRAPDAEGDTLAYSLSGTDAALFTIDANTGEVSFMAAPDFEVPGDDDGDNVYDIIVTASDGTNSTDHNVAITVTDEYDLIPLSSLDGTNGFTLNGIDGGDYSGSSVSSAGDVNGDGYDDLIIGAWKADPGGDSYAGETYVIYGGARAPGTDGVLDLSDLDGTNGFTLTGIDAFDRSGISVSSAGDVNGDGYDDLIIGARFADPNGDSNAGETYVIYGGASAPGTGGRFNLSTLDGTNGFILSGIDRDDNSGQSVSSAGDVNGDGYDDLIIGAGNADPNGRNSGETYIVYGGASAPGTDGVLDLSDLDGSNGFTLTGIDGFDYSGSSVSSAGDVNGDGYDDLIIGAFSAAPNGDSEAGETYIVYGGARAPGTEGVLDLSDLDGTNGFILTGIDASDRSGISVSSAGDVNGDGYDDLIIGAYRADPNGDSYVGETYLIYGGASAPGTDGVLDLSALNGTNGFILTGIDVGDESGQSVSSAGDVNGDGYDDLIIGANRADPNGDLSGETYVVYGGASAPGTGGVLDLGALDGSNGFILTGIDAYDQSGFSVSSAGDVNGDGYDDLIIGANRADPNGERLAGETYVIYGGAMGTESLVPVTASGTTTADNFTGNAGADSFTGIATDDVVRGGAGDDNIRVTALDFAAIDGGTGVDTLVLDGAGLALDLTGPGNAGVDSVELFDLSGTGANTLVLDAQAVFDVTEEREGGAASLDVLGDADDRVDLSGGNFARTGTATEDGTTYTVYRDGNAQLRIEAGVQVSTLPVFTSPATASARENQASAYMAAATDADGDTLVYSLSGTDAALFTIDADTGEVRFIAVSDFEAPGDDGGDNVYDITVTASDGTNSTNHNVAITVTDEYDLIPLSSLDGSNGFILTGIDANDQSGTSVSSAGDVNGDGYDDLIIGAYRADPNGDNDAGETYVVYGGASAPGTDGVLDLSDLDGTNGFILTGIDVFDRSGISVSSAGDVNGDGYDDLIIGANTADPNGDNNAGETYVVYGGARAPGTDGVLDLSDLDGTNGFILTGIDGSDFSGRSVSSAGDVNGDGYDDLIIGAYAADPNGDSLAGETYVVYGGASAPGTEGVLDLSDLDGTNGFILTGIDVFDRSGHSVSSAGDVNGDGYDDLIIGAWGADPNGDSLAGETYIVYGGASAPGTGGMLDLSSLNGTNGFILTGIDASDYSSFSVSSAGDVNGDGYDDLIIGARFADPNGDIRAGETYVVYGGANAPGTDGMLDLGALNGSNGFILTGIDAGDWSGGSVSSAGDVNGDGYDDLIIGARYADPNGDGSGETYIIYGGASAPGTEGVLDLEALNGSNGFILTGIDAGDQSGGSVSSAGDVNGDGYDDLIIGARYAAPNGDTAAGETYIVYGGATGTESLVPVTAQGTAAADNFTGNAGDDSFTDIATNDVVRGGAGNDTISITALDFAAIDGGTGQDTLVLDGAGLALDLTGPGNAGVDSVEVFDLSGTGANSLVLDAQAVFDVTEERAGGAASLDVLGDADDRIDLSGSSFALTGTAAEDGVTYNVYRDGNTEVRIENGVMVTLAATGSQSAESKTDPKTDPGTDPGSGTIRLDGALMNPDPLMNSDLWNSDLWNSDLWNNDLWDGLWADGVRSLDQPVHIDEDAILIPLSDPLSFGPLASGPLPGPWGDLIYWPGLGNHPAMQNDLAMILPEMEIVTADMEGF